MAVFKWVQFTNAVLEWRPEARECRLAGRIIDKEHLMRLAVTQLVTKTARAQIASRLRQLKRYLEPTQEQKERIPERCFAETEDLKDCARKWWSLVRQDALPLKDFSVEFSRMKKVTKEQKELKTEIKRRAGRNHQPLTFKTREIQGQLGELLDGVLKESENVASCEQGLRNLKELKLFPKARWKEWHERVTWDENGLVDQNQIREWIDGERFIAITQREEDNEAELEIREKSAWIQGFFKRSKWRRRLARYWHQWNQKWEQEQIFPECSERSCDPIDGSEGHSILHLISVVTTDGELSTRPIYVTSRWNEGAKQYDLPWHVRLEA
jgi:hypothetical protein